MVLKRILRKAAELGIGLTAISALLLAGCGGGGSNTSAADSTTATVTPFKGMFSNGQIAVRDANGAYITLLNGSGNIGANGTATVTYPNTVTYPLVFEAAGTYYNELTKASEVSATPIRSLLADAASVASGIPVTAVTEIAVATLQNQQPGGTFSTSHPIIAASAVAALNAAGTMLGIPASTIPVFDAAAHTTSDPNTLYLAALAVVANSQTGATLADKIKTMANSFASLNPASAPTALINQTVFNNALIAMTTGASSVLASGAAPAPSTINTANYGTLYSDAVTAANTSIAAATACRASGGTLNPLMQCIPAAVTGGTTGSGSVTCNTAHYSTGAVRVPTSTELTSYAKTYSGNTGTFDTNFVFTPSGTTVFVFSSAGALTYNSVAQTVASICKDTTLPMMYVEFGTDGSVDLFADGTFTGFTSTAMYQSAGLGTSGGTGGTITQGFTNGSFGTLTLAGASAAGTSFASQSAFVGGDPMLNFYSWANGALVTVVQPPSNLALPTTNSVQVVINTNKTTNTLSYVGLNMFGATPSQITTWGVSTGFSGVNVNLAAKTVTFTNVALPVITGTSTTVTLNGTLSFP